MGLWQIAAFLRRKCKGHPDIFNTGPLSERIDSQEFLMVSGGQGYRVKIERIELAS